MSTVQLSEALQNKYGTRLSQQQTNHAGASIEIQLAPNNTSIELPQEIKALITGTDFWVNAKSNRYKKLVREGHLDKLLELANMARSKDNPANWFAVACSKKAWERTLVYLAKITEVARKAEHVARRLGTKVNKFIYKQIWKGVNVERWAVAAEEISHDKPGQSREKHFAWLCVNEQRLAM